MIDYELLKTTVTGLIVDPFFWVYLILMGLIILLHSGETTGGLGNQR